MRIAVLPAALIIGLSTPALATEGPALPSPSADSGFGSVLFSRCLALATYGVAGSDGVCKALGAVLAGGSLPTSPSAVLAPEPVPTEPPIGDQSRLPAEW
jgi:hypothetical protein